MRTYLVLFLFYCLQSPLQAQSTEIDSLITILDQSESGDEKSLVLIDIVDFYLSSDIEASSNWADKLIEEAQKCQTPDSKALSIYAAGRPWVYYFSDEMMLKAKTHMLEGLHLSKQHKLIHHEMNFHTMLGVIYGYFNQTDKALQHYFEIIDNAQHIENKSTLSATYSNMGRIFQEGEDSENATKYYSMAVALNREIPNYEFLAISLANLGSVTKDVQQAEEYIKEAIQLVGDYEMGDFRLGTFQGYLGDLFLNKKQDYLAAIKAYYKCLSATRKANDKTSESACSSGLAKSYLKVNEQDSVLYYLHKSIEIDKSIENEFNLRFNYEALKDYYAGIGNYEDAFLYASLASSISDSIYNKEKANALSSNAIRFETLEKENKIIQQDLEIAKKDSQRNRILAGSVILLLLLGGIFSWYFERQKRKKKVAELALETEKKEANRLREIDQMKMQFFTNVSHELKTPLTLVLGPLTQALEKTEDGDVKKNIIVALNNAERLDELINETLDFRKIEKGSIHINETARAISSDLRRMFFGFSSLAEMREIELVDEIQLDADLYLSLDINKVEKIINNLVSNALKFSSNGEQVTMAARYENGKLEVRVKDNGMGIPAEEHEKIFNRFYQATHNLSGNYGGTGVGLAYAKELAELMNGSLVVESEVGKGSVFTLVLPGQVVEANAIIEEELKEAEATDQSTIYQPILIHGEKPDLLIVEDNREMQEYLVSILEDDYNCHVAYDGYDAIRKVQTKNYHLISSDVMMPNMDGFRLKEKINEIPKVKGLPFIFLTARSLDEDKLSGLRLGVDDYITKPFNKEEYKARINNLLKNYNERTEEKDGAALFELTESVDIQKLKEAEKKVLEHISDPSFKVSELADHLHYSQRQLARVIKQLTGMSPVGFILELRLQRAYHLIKSKSHESISEVKDLVGIESASYFSRKFKERFGLSPSEV